MKRLLQLLIFISIVTCIASATNSVYIAQSAVGAGSGVDCNDAVAYTYFNNASNWSPSPTGIQIGPGTTVHVCGTLTFTSNSTGLAFQGNGTSGSPVTLIFETGAIIQAPYFASSAGGASAGGITLGNGRSWLTVDGNNTGTIQNTANGSSLANQQASTLISGFNCNHCTIQNLSLLNAYVNVNGNSTIGDSSVIRAIDPSGPNWIINHNTFSHCGWCLFSSYANNDTNEVWSNNTFTHFGHAAAFAAGSSVNCIASCLFFFGNDMNAGIDWDAVGCFAHKDGIHLFGGPAGAPTSTMDGVYISNNYFHGDWGTCSTGFIFAESGGSAAGLKTWAVWNNVGVVTNTSFVNTNGWMNISSGTSGTQSWLNNTIIGNCQNDNSLGFGLTNLSSLTYENNTASCIGDPIRIDSSTLASTNFNFYGSNVCQNGGNCFIWNGAFKGSFAAWKTACACDTNAISNLTPLLNADGSPQTNSPVIGAAANLTSIATGNLASLQNDTTKGTSRTSVARPTGANWDIGAYQFSSLNPPTGLQVLFYMW